jgi:hypothetical protein
MSAPDRKAEAKRLSILLWDLNLSNKEAIAACGCNPRTLFRWLAGESPIPKPVLTMFELMLEKQQTALAEKPESE